MTVKVVFVLSVLFSLAALTGLCSCRNVGYTPGGNAVKEDLEIRAMTFNIRYGTADDGRNRWENRRDAVFDVLRENQPDLIGLQEALRFQIDQIRRALTEYGELGVGRDDGKTQGEYCAILYRLTRFNVDESWTFWFSDTPKVPGSNQWGNACVRICTWARLLDKKSGGGLYIYNLHLDHVSQQGREKSVILLTKRIAERKHKDPFVVTGDFNAGQNNPAVMYLKGKAVFDDGRGGKLTNPVLMVDTFRVLHPDATEVGTFHEFKGGTTGEKIDYIFAPPGVVVVESQIIRTQYNGRWPSDHFPVTARLHLSAGDKRHPAKNETSLAH
jgi:endonuclease/exonuclease/phosphatase family metal-dependent hydrolase